MPIRTRSQSERFLYQLVPQTPPLDAREIDSAELAVEIVVVWGESSVLHVAHLSPPRAFHVGDDAQHADFVIGEETLGSRDLPIVHVQDDKPVLVLTHAARAELEREGERMALENPERDRTRAFPLQLGDCARVSHGAITFVVRAVAAARPELAAVRVQPNLKGSRWTLASAALHASLLLTFYLLPPASGVLALDQLDTSSRLVKFQIDAREHEDPPPQWTEAQPGEAQAERARDAEGGSGPPEAPRRQRPGGGTSSPRVAPPAPDPAQAGILPLLRNNLGILAGGHFTADKAQNGTGYGSLGDTLARLGNGGPGLGMIGFGRGGGGDAAGTLGVGRLGTTGVGTGSGNYGAGTGGFKAHIARVPRIRMQEADVNGSLSKDIIRRVIGRHINEIRFCYEQELISHPDLQGRVAVKFVIAPTGVVQTAVVEKTDLGNLAAESCIAKAVRRWSFPAPQGGGMVVVSYPFLLSQAGG